MTGEDKVGSDLAQDIKERNCYPTKTKASNHSVGNFIHGSVEQILPLICKTLQNREMCTKQNMVIKTSTKIYRLVSLI
jgi:hypothetical protein